MWCAARHCAFESHPLRHEKSVGGFRRFFFLIFREENFLRRAILKGSRCEAYVQTGKVGADQYVYGV